MTRPLPEALNSVVAGPWPFLQNRVLFDPGASEGIALTELQRPVVLHAYLTAFARAQGETDRRGVVSLWTQWYAVAVWPALTIASVVLGRVPALEPQRCALLLDASGCPQGILVGEGEAALPVATVLERLARHHAGPLLEAAAHWGGVATRVPWSNCANVLGWTLSELKAHSDSATLAPAYEVINAPAWADGTTNGLFVGSACDPSTGRPPRRVCCLRYRLAETPYCADCPIPSAPR